jgi:hypothetical protein
VPAFPGGHPTTRNLNYVWNASTLVWDKMTQSSGGGSGTVTSVALSLPADFTVSGSPVTTAGTLTAVWANVSANLVLAGPASGGAATPAFRSLVEADTTLADVTTNNVTSTKHGYAPKAPADATKFLNGAATPAYAAVKDTDLSTSDVTTNNVDTTKHGFAPKLPNDATKFLDGTGAYSVPASGSGLDIIQTEALLG